MPCLERLNEVFDVKQQQQQQQKTCIDFHPYKLSLWPGTDSKSSLTTTEQPNNVHGLCFFFVFFLLTLNSTHLILVAKVD